MIIVDASAAVEYLLQTPRGLRVEAVLGRQRLASPELLDAEVMAVLRREVLAGKLGQRRAAEAVMDLRDWGLERVSHRPLLGVAWELRSRVTAYDAFYVALARARHAPLVTADGALARAGGLGVIVHEIRAE